MVAIVMLMCSIKNANWISLKSHIRVTAAMEQVRRQRAQEVAEENQAAKVQYRPLWLIDTGKSSSTVGPDIIHSFFRTCTQRQSVKVHSGKWSILSLEQNDLLLPRLSYGRRGICLEDVRTAFFKTVLPWFREGALHSYIAFHRNTFKGCKLGLVTYPQTPTTVEEWSECFGSLTSLGGKTLDW